METKANFFLNAVLVLLVLTGIVGFVHWFETGSVTGRDAAYHIVFQGSVGGLIKGADVELNGMKIGEVSDLRFDLTNPKHILATIAVDSDAPLRTDTQIRLRFGTVTGVAWIELRGGDPRADIIPAGPDGIPTLIADEKAAEGISGAAHDLGNDFDVLIGDNSALQKSLANFAAFTAVLTHNSDRFDRVLAGMEGLAGTDDKPGELMAAAKSIRLMADDLSKNMDLMSGSLEQFTGSGLKNIDALMAETRRTVATAETVFKNIKDSPMRLLLGGGSVPQRVAPAARPPRTPVQ
jgi:phospholipid/cholesterol/gamma-HCH transport system substrate-binding protein